MMRAQTHRTERVGQLVRSIISTALLQETHNSLWQRLVITDVVMTKDLRIARIYYTGESAEKEIRAALPEMTHFLRKRLAEQGNLRFVPELLFFRDSHTEEVQHIFELLKGIHEPRKESDEV